MTNQSSESALTRFTTTLEIAAGKLLTLLEAHPDAFPLVTARGKWVVSDVAGAGPLAGCLPAMMWDLHEALGDVRWREQAEHYCRLIDTQWPQDKADGAGLAFYFGGHRRWYETTVRDGTPDSLLRDRLIQLGRHQAKRFVSTGQYIGTPPGQDLLNIESMLDVPLMLFAAAESQDHDLGDLAARHCATVRRYLVRGDGSVCAAAKMNPLTGQFEAPLARAGARPGSTWACGQAWAILGFATSGRLLSFEPWLQTARQAAQFLIERLSTEPVPPWDLDAPARPQPQPDSAAAAVAATALLELADAEQTVGPDQARLRRHLQETALRILDTLCTADYLASASDAWEGLLKHAAGNLPAGWAVDESVIWGDAFLVQALTRATRLLRSSRF